MFQPAWKCRVLNRVVQIAFVAVSLAVPAAAQQVNSGTETGLPIYGSFQTGKLDVINLENGNLHIAIPLLDVRERGRTFAWSYMYDTPSWQLAWVPKPTPQNQNAGFYQVTRTDDPDWRLSTPFSWILNFVSMTATCPSTGIEYSYWDQYNVEDPEGTKHQLPLRAENSICQGQVLSGPATDGSGIVFTLNKDADGVYDTGVVTLKDGTQINLQSGVLMDANGNTASASSDMLKRNLVTTTSGTLGNGTPYTDYNILDSGGHTETFQVQYATFNFQTNLCSNVPTYTCNEYSGTASEPVKLVLPNGLSYQFSYQNNSMLQMTQISLPTGGTISYSTGLEGGVQPDTGREPTYIYREGVATRTINDGTGNYQWTYSATGGGITVTDPAGNQQVHAFNYITINNVSSPSPVETSVSYYQGSASTGTLLKTVSNTWTGETANTWGTNFLGNMRVTKETTTLDNGQESQVQTDYETFTLGSFVYTRLNATERREYGYGSGSPGPLMRRTDWTYLHTNNQTYMNLNIVDRVTSMITYDGSGNVVAQTQNEFDNYTQTIQSTGAVQHNSSFGSSYTTRGNMTATKRWRNTDGAWLTTRNQYNDVGDIISTTDPKNNTTSFDYSDVWANSACAPSGGPGLAYLTKVTDAVGETTNNSYYSCTGLEASATDPNGQTTTFTYDGLNRVLLTSYPDGGQTSVCYSDDPSGTCYSSSLPIETIRKKLIQSGTYLTTTQVYDDLGRLSQTQVNSDPSGIVYIDTTYDGLGRIASVSNPYRSKSEATYGVTYYKYDGLDRKTQITDPDGMKSIVSTSYSGNSTTVTDEAGNQRRSFTDALGRLIEVDEPGTLPPTPPTPGTGSVTIDGSEQYSSSCGEYDIGTVSITVNGYLASAGYGQTSTADSIAQVLTNDLNNSSSPVTASLSGSTIDLTSKATGSSSNYSLSANSSSRFGTRCFPGGASFTADASGSTLTGGTNGSSGTTTFSLSTPFQTFYSYDALGNLLEVQQEGNDSNSADWRTRIFTYDSLSHLLTSNNPEAGAVTYTYDNDGNVLTKKDARGITTTYSYDPVNRLTGATYSNGDPSVSYAYSGTNCLGQPSCYNIGRRTAMTDATGSEAWSYDKMGRVLVDQRTTSGVTKTTTYTYLPYVDGSLYQVTYPSGRKITYSYNGVEEPLSVTDTSNSINYASQAIYAPQAALANVVLGNGTGFNGVSIASSYNDRLQPVEIKASSTAGTAMDLTYNFNLGAGDNGNVIGVTNNTNSARTESFTYDALNRIKTAQTQGTTGSNCFGFQFTYDAWANITDSAVLSGYSSCSNTTGFAFDPPVNAENQVATTGFNYDANGNVLGDGFNSYAWNAESEVKTTDSINYSYDGLGERVEKSNGTIYWYGLGGEVLDETDLSGNLKNEYVYFGGKRIAMRDSSGNIYYYIADHLGSSRVITNSSGSTCYDADFLPYGQEVDYTGSCGSNYKFEGKERDTETGNDDFGARYYRSLVGRWMSPDWSAIPAPVPYANLTNPQTLNLYAMVSDNPETFADLDGHDATGGGLGNSATPDWASMGASQPSTKVACTPSPLGPLCTVTGQTQTVSSDQEKVQNATQAAQQKDKRNVSDLYYLDYKGHGGPHIDRVDKNGKLVGRYDENGNPIKFKGEKPPQIPNSDKQNFGKAANKLRDYKNREQAHAQQHPSSPQKSSAVKPAFRPFFFPFFRPFPAFPMPEPIPIGEPIPIPF